MADITMPQLGETVTEGTITRWFKAIGERIEEDEVLFEVSTDKVDSEVPSPVAGFLTEIRVPEGDTVEVGAVLAVVGDQPPDGDQAEPAAEASEPEPEPEPAAETEPAEPEPAEPEPAEPEPEPDPAAEAPEPEPAPATEGSAGGGRLLSPVVRRLISEHDLDPDQITGTGAGGRITRRDVLARVEGGPAPSAKPAPAAEPAPASKPAPAPAARPAEGDEVVPFNRIRTATAEHMLRSKATSAHVLTAVEVDFESVERVRRAHKEEFKQTHGASLTYLPFITRALVEALQEFPRINASVGDGELVVHRAINVGIAVDLDFEGLIVPVIKAADTKRLPALATEVADLADRARSKKLSADDITGGTFTITNPGPYGTFVSAPVINQPQVAILSTEGVKRRPVVVEMPDGSEGIAVHAVGYLCMSWDHRAFDGAYAAAFLDRLRTELETRDWEAEL